MHTATVARSSRRDARLPVRGEVVDGRYLVLSELGGGSGGVVFLAGHVVTGQHVAMKWLRPEHAASLHAVPRFAREIRIASSLRHPSVVRVLDAGEALGGRYLVTEHANGRCLADVFSGGAVPAAPLVDMLLPALRAVAAAHDAGIVHRDLKPENLIVGCVEDDGSGGTKVLDFGISRSASLEEEPLTREGAMLGSPAYTAPEQLRDPRDADARSDIYSMGVVLYEGLTGRQPFEGSTLSELARRILAGCPAPIRSLRADVPPALAEIVHRALAREPARRPQSMRALLEALERWRNAEHPRATDVAPIAHVPAHSRAMTTEKLQIASRDVESSIGAFGAVAIASAVGMLALACAASLGT